MDSDLYLLLAMLVIIITIAVVVIFNNIWLSWVGVAALLYIFFKDNGD